MPAKKAKRTKKTHKMHAAKKLGKVKPLAVGTSLLTTSLANAPSSPSSHTGTDDGNSFSLGASQATTLGTVSSSSTTVPGVSVPPGMVIKP